MTRASHRRFLQTLAWLLVVSLTWSAERVSLAASPQNTSPRGWQELQTAAPGTKVEVTLTSGAKVRGRLTELDSDAVRLNANEIRRGRFIPASTTALSDTQTFRRADVTAVTVDKWRFRPSYRSSGGTPDAEAVRRVVTALSVGKTVNLKTATARRIRARILSFDDRGFTIRRGSSPAGLRIAYGDVVELEPAGMRASVKGAMIAGVAAAVTLIAVFSWLEGLD